VDVYLSDGFKFRIPLFSIGSPRGAGLWTVRLLRHPVGSVLPLFTRGELADRAIEVLEFVGHERLPLPDLSALGVMLARCKATGTAFATFDYCVRPGYTSERLVPVGQIAEAVGPHLLAPAGRER
jgi:hypothetical protein